MRRKVLIGALSVAAVAAVAVVGFQQRERLARGHRLREALQASRGAPSEKRNAALHALAELEEEEALVALAEAWRATRKDEAALQSFLLALELATARGPVDPTVVALIEEEAKGATDHERLVVSFLIEELRTPTYPRGPENAWRGWARADLSKPRDAAKEIGEALGLTIELASKVIIHPRPDEDGFCGTGIGDGGGWRSDAVLPVGRTIDRPWRLLLRFAQSQDCRVELVEGRAVLTRRPTLLSRPSPHEGDSLAFLVGRPGDDPQLLRVRFMPPAQLDDRLDVDAVVLSGAWPPEKALAAIAACCGAKLEKRDERTFDAIDTTGKTEALIAGRATALAKTLEAARSGLEDDRRHALQRLAGFEEPEALLFLIETWAKQTEEDEELAELLVRAVELHAAEPARDRRPAEALLVLARDPVRSFEARFLAWYLLAELEAPTHAVAPSSSSDSPPPRRTLASSVPSKVCPRTRDPTCASTRSFSWMRSSTPRDRIGVRRCA